VARNEARLDELADEIRADHGVHVRTAAIDLTEAAPTDMVAAAVGCDVGLLVVNAGSRTHYRHFVDDPGDDASAWTMRDATLPADSHGAAFAGAVMLHDGHLYAYGENAGAGHDIVVARWAQDAAAAGDLSAPEWWCGDAWRGDCGGAPAVVVHLGAPEQSVSADGRLAPFVMVQSEGYGATTLAVRTAPAPEGPWSDPVSFFRPPESLDDDAFVYAGKAHPELAGADLVATYVPSTFGTSDDPSLYHPHFVRMTYR